MLTVEGGLPFTHQILFEAQGNVYDADANSVQYRLLNASGATLIPWTPFNNLQGVGSVAVEIPEVHHPLPIAPVLFQVRHLDVSWMTEQTVRQVRRTYRVTGFLPFSVSTQDVRTLIGVTADDLPDVEIDLVTAYFQALAAQGSAFSSALTSGEIGQIAANDVILCGAVLAILPGLQLRVVASTQDGALKIDRFKNIDFKAIARETQNRLTAALSKLSSSSTSASYMVLSNPTDPITGA
jgi:hypothetical protein